jgi:hypothetical protein
VDAANYIESIKSSNKEPDPRQMKYFRNSVGTNAYEMLFGGKNNMKRKTEPGKEIMEEGSVMEHG